jgi:hypothetical protein
LSLVDQASINYTLVGLKVRFYTTSKPRGWTSSKIELSSRPEYTLIHCGGHFSGSSIFHWAEGAEARAVFLTGDTIFVIPDTRYVSFMYSVANLIPLGANEILHILKVIDPFKYDRIYSGWHCCKKDAKQAVAASAARYTKLGLKLSI